MAETKQCPDCAEQVLAAARKCRYCGYRFDRGTSAGSALGELLAGMRREKRDVTLAEVIADWDVSLAEGEEATLFRLADLDRHLGYVFVTGTRVMFFVARGRGRHDKLLERSLGEISHARIRGSLGRREIEFGGSGWEHTVRLYAKGDTQLLADVLTQHLDANARYT